MKTINNRLILFRFHPLTGKDAEDFTGDATPEGMKEIENDRKKGAKYYWLENDLSQPAIMIGDSDSDFKNEPYSRVERGNIAFVADMMKFTVITIEKKPSHLRLAMKEVLDLFRKS